MKEPNIPGSIGNGFFMAELAQPISDIANLKLPDPWLLSYYRLAQDRKLWVDHDIDTSILDIERSIMLYNMEDKGKPIETRQPITLYIMSYGGDADSMWSLIDTILASDTPIITVNMGKCDSAAALIFMAGHIRLMMGRSSVTIHEGGARFDGDSTKVIDASESYKVMLKKMHKYIVSRTRIPPATLTKKKNNDWELDSEYCLEHGVCDRIVEKLSEII